MRSEDYQDFDFGFLEFSQALLIFVCTEPEL